MAAAFLSLIAVIAVVGVLHALHIERQVSTVPQIIQQGEVAAEKGQLGAAEAALLRAQSILAAANSALYNSPDFVALDVFPVAKQNLAALRRATTLGLQMIGGGEQILRAAAPLKAPDGHLEVPLRSGQLPLATTEAIRSAIDEVVSSLPTTATPPDGGLLIGKVRSAEQRVYTEAAKRRSEFESVASAIRVLDDIAGASGNKRYVIAVANSAEMRGSGGMILSYGVLTSHAGKLSLGRFGDIDELKLSQAETAVLFPADFASTYSDLAPTQNWRNANMMSDFTIDAPVLEAMYTKATGLPVDGVIQVDPAGLGALLAGVGPIATPDLGTATAANVVSLTLHQAYVLFPNRQKRQDYTGEVARAAFSQLVDGNFAGLRPLGVALVRAGKQRHVLMYANDQTDETAVRTLGFAGQLPSPTSEFTQLTIQNFGGDKLDYYLQSALSLRGSRPSALGSHIAATVTLANTAPVGQSQPAEVFGPFNPGGTPGTYQGLVTLYLPTGSYLQSSQTDSSATTDPLQTTQNGITAVTFTVSVPAGVTSSTVLHIYVPPTPSKTGTFVFVPSPRVQPTVYTQKLT